MRLFIFIAIYVVGSLSVLSEVNIQQPQDPAVIIFDMRGGQKPRTADGPVLTLHASGKLIVRAKNPGEPPQAIQISPKDQQFLISMLVEELGVLEMSTASIEQDILKGNTQIRSFPDAPITFLSIDLPSGSTLINIKGVSALSYLVPNASSLHRFLSIQRYLLDYADQINAEHNG